MKKKSYIRPVLSAVDLDPEQAILSICAVAETAAWINASTTKCFSGTYEIFWACVKTPKGADAGFHKFWHQDSSPS
ncbi:MAG: hypothetical protein PHQ52_05955 [Candidatus Omnitrophica bacterium]|nr:hypothetical protein [Candidatus Omnitrophota bacterium]